MSDINGAENLSEIAGLSTGDAPTLLRGVSLPGSQGVWDLQLIDGSIASVTASSGSSSGFLALPAFADLHLHADRAFVRAEPRPKNWEEARRAAEDVRDNSSAEEVAERGVRLLSRAFQHGTLHARTNVDHPSTENTRALEGMVAARAVLPRAMTVELVAFTNSDLDPAEIEAQRHLIKSLDNGADLVGGWVAACKNPKASVSGLLRLAKSQGVDVDMHLDEHLDTNDMLITHVAQETIALGLEERVTLGHCCALGVVSPESVAATAKLVASAGITITSLPATNLYLMDRGMGGHPRERGIAPLRELLDAGVSVRFGSDNVADVFYPYGDADPLESAFLASIGAHIDDSDALVSGISNGRSTLEAGQPADIVLIRAESLRDALSRRPAGRIVLKNGTVVSS